MSSSSSRQQQQQQLILTRTVGSMAAPFSVKTATVVVYNNIVRILSVNERGRKGKPNEMTTAHILCGVSVVRIVVVVSNVEYQTKI